MKKRTKKQRQRQTEESLSFFPILLCLTSGLLTALTFTRWQLEFLIWISLIPYLISLADKTLRQRMLLSWVFGLVFFLGTIYWIGHVSFLGLAALCLYLSLYPVLFGLAAVNKGGILSLFLLPTAWVATEFLRSHAFSGFGWGLLGYTQFRNLPLLQSARISGVWGLSYLVVLVNLALAQALLYPERCRRNLTVALLLLAVFASFGAYSLNRPVPSLPVSLSVIQPNIAQEDKWDPDKAPEILARFEQLSLKAAREKPDLIVWPETSVPGYLQDEKWLRDNISALAQSLDSWLLVGGPRENVAANKYYNSAFLFSPAGELRDVHDKLHLVPFGEYIPLRPLFRFLPDYGIADFSSGSTYDLFSLPGKTGGEIKFGVLICFEDVFPDLVRRFREQGADFLLVITNEAWFKKSDEPLQHLAISVFRAVENHCWFARSANTGISGFIDPQGRITGLVQKNNREIFIPGYKTQSLTVDSD